MELADADVIIVGAGAAGAAAAWRLSAGGLQAVCLERGDWQQREDMPATSDDWEILRQTKWHPSPAQRVAAGAVSAFAFKKLRLYAHHEKQARATPRHSTSQCASARARTVPCFQAVALASESFGQPPGCGRRPAAAGLPAGRPALSCFHGGTRWRRRRCRSPSRGRRTTRRRRSSCRAS